MRAPAPIYIPSKGRADSRMTMRALDAMGVAYHVIVESQEFDAYAAVIPRERLLVLDPAYQRDYDACDDLGMSKSKGSGPARNFAWDHAAASGAEHHWTVDDNIKAFYRLSQNTKIAVADGVCFVAMEDFCNRYANVAMAGPNYFMFAKRKQKIPPFVANTRIYSCNLIQTRLPFRWRGRYNEDTDLSLRLLKAGFCTVQFNAFLQHKMATQTMRGGNTDTVYVGGTLPKSQMIARLHPDVARIVWKFGRVHHHVDYRPFRTNKLIRRADVEIPEGCDEYGLRLIVLEGRAHGNSRPATEAHQATQA
jgi:hypothetical protein